MAAEISCALALDDALDRLLAHPAGLSGTAIDRRLILESAIHAMGVAEVAQGRPPQGNRFTQNLTHGLKQAARPARPDAIRGCAGVNAGPKEGLTGIDIPGTHHRLTRQKHLLDRRSPALQGMVKRRHLQSRIKGLRTESRQQIGRRWLVKTGRPHHGAESAGIVQAQQSAVGPQFEMIVHTSVWDHGARRPDTKRPRHPQVDQQPRLRLQAFSLVRPRKGHPEVLAPPHDSAQHPPHQIRRLASQGPSQGLADLASKHPSSAQRGIDALSGDFDFRQFRHEAIIKVPSTFADDACCHNFRVEHLPRLPSSLHARSILRPRWKTLAMGWATSLALGLSALAASAEESPSELPAASPGGTSNLDAQGFYQLLIAEIERRNGRPAVAFELTLDTARRLKDGELFQRAAQMAVEGRSVDRALNATRAWRQALPRAMEPLRLQIQLLALLNRLDDLSEPLQLLLKQSEPEARLQLIASLPGLLANATDTRKAAMVVEASLKRYAAAAPTRTAALTATARLWWQAQQGERSLALLQQALIDEPQAPAPGLLAIEMMKSQAGARALAQQAVAVSLPTSPLQLAYARTLLQSQNLTEARQHLENLTASPGAPSGAWLLLGVTLLDLKSPQAAKVALERFLSLEAQHPSKSGAESATGDDESQRSEAGAAGPVVSRDQARLLLAQLELDEHDWIGMNRILDAIEDPARRWEVLSLRAGALWRQDRLDEGLQLLREAPEQDPQDSRAKLRAQVQLLRQAERLSSAYELLDQMRVLDPQDDELIYEQAMLAERLKRPQRMEELLREILQRDPKHVQANNALGYSLADRGERLEEARRLIQTALDGAPGDPFITDSLGWLEFRLGRTEQALKLLRQAHGARPDPEIAAHLGEVLWVSGQRDQARSIWEAALKVDPRNEVLRETMQRLTQAR